MNTYEAGPEFDSDPPFIVLPPATEILHNPARSAALWANDSEQATELVGQVGERNTAAQHITEILDALPTGTPSIEKVIAHGHLSEEQASQLYSSLGAILADPDYARLALYLPFELLPDSSWQPKSSELQQNTAAFRQTYLSAWHSLLHIHDVRSNFVDGDVLEESYRNADLPRVVKAAHLIPGLLQKRLIDETDVVRMHQWTADPVLRQSIAEGLAAYHSAQEHIPADRPKQPFRTIEQVVEEGIHAIKNMVSSLPQNVSERRREWLSDTERDKIIASAGEEIGRAIRMDALPPATVSQLLQSTNPDAYHMLLEGIRRAIVTATDSDRAHVLFTQYYATLSALRERADSNIADRLAIAFRHFVRIGIIDKTVLDEWDIDLPNLRGPHSENLAGIAKDVERLGTVAAQIEADSELSRYLYPVAVIGGSRLKGYGQQTSDIDVSVFVRPDTPATYTPYIRTLLGRLFTLDGKQYEPIEFWLDDVGDAGLYINNGLSEDAHTADSYWTHVLFGGAWVGAEQAVEELQRRLLPSYFHTNAATRDERRLYLERMEQDLLQYRLMHKGYVRQYPLQVRDRSTYHPAIDGSSTFWDPGYRRLATRLFVNNVFLPKFIRYEL